MIRTALTHDQASDTQVLTDEAPLRQVQCGACQGEGRTYHGVRGGNDPDEYSVTCRECSGDGWIVEEVEADDDRNCA